MWRTYFFGVFIGWGWDFGGEGLTSTLLRLEDAKDSVGLEV